MTTLIRWKNYGSSAAGWVNRMVNHKYVISTFSDTAPFGVDVRKNEYSWHCLDIPVESIEAGMQLCEMWEATGAY